MPADLGLVANAAQADAGELPPEGLGDGFTETRLADARRSHEAQDGALDVGLHLEHGQELQDPILDLLQIVVLRFQDLLGFGDVVHVVGTLVPGNTDDPIEVRSPTVYSAEAGGSCSAGLPRVEPPSWTLRACRRLRSFPGALRSPWRSRRSHPVPSGWPSSAHAGSTRAGFFRLRP